MIQRSQIKLGTLLLCLILLLCLLQLLLFLLKNLIHSLLQVVLQFSFRGQFSFKLGSCALVLLSDIIDHLLQLIYNPFIPLCHLLLCLGLFLRMIYEWIGGRSLVWHRR